MAKKREAYVRRYAQRGKLTKRLTSEALDAIWAEFEGRLKTSWHTGPYSQSKNEQAKYFLRREIYALGLAILDASPTGWSTADLVRKIRLSVSRPDKLGNVFHDLLMCVYDDDSQVSRRERSNYALEMEYARRHEVRPELLCGFILQSGGHGEISRKLRANYVEPAFREALGLEA